MRYPKGAEEWIVLVVVIGLLAMILFFLTACAQQQKVANIDVLWSGEKCLFHSQGMTIEQAKNIKKTWNFDNCEVDVTANADGKGAPKHPPKD